MTEMTGDKWDNWRRLTRKWMTGNARDDWDG